MFKGISLRARVVISVSIFVASSMVVEAIVLHAITFKSVSDADNGIILIDSLFSLASVFFALFIVNHFVLAKITKLKNDVVKISDASNSANRLDIKGSDEFSILAKNFNSLLDNLEKFKLAIENSSDHIVITDPDLNILYANKGAEKMTGYTKEEMLGKTPKLWQQEDNLKKILDATLNNKIPFEAEIENRNKSGELYPVEAKIFPLLDKNGQVKLLVSVQHDISSSRRLREALIMENQQIAQEIQEKTGGIEDEKAKLLGLINSISLGFLMFNTNGKVMLVNPAIEKIMNLKLDNGDVNSVDSALGGKFAIKDKFQKCLTEKQQIIVKELYFNNRYLRLIISPIFSPREIMSLIGVAFLIEDNTESKMAERSKDEFFSIASHELRTPLTAIRGNTSLLRTYKDKLSPQDREAMVDDINTASVRLIGIVNDFLDTSRLESGKMTYKKETINLVQLAEETIKEYQTTGSLKMLYLTFVPPQNPLGNVIGDKDKVKQVLVNLVGNAVKYTDKGGVIITVERDNGFTKVLVTDTGRGITQDQQSGLFNKFHPIAGPANYTRNVIEGTGLGLYISKMMTEGMGGKIALEKSAPDVGSTFSFELPIAVEASI